eukprot:6687096-Ditylum_brightwellii.AAC.1
MQPPKLLLYFKGQPERGRTRSQIHALLESFVSILASCSAREGVLHAIFFHNFHCHYNHDNYGTATSRYAEELKEQYQKWSEWAKLDGSENVEGATEDK